MTEPTQIPDYLYNVPVLVAEGDSWFSFPFGIDVVNRLRQYGCIVESVADWSHTLESMVSHEDQKAGFTRALKRLSDSQTPPMAVLFSGGGNDFIDKLPLLLNSKGPQDDPINNSVLDEFIAGLQCKYATWLDFATSAYKTTFDVEKPVPILVHGYGYVVPNASWLQPAFAAKNYTDLAQNTTTMRTLLNCFNEMLKAVASAQEHVHYVDLRPTLTDNDWQDEIHPTFNGFDKITGKFRKVIESTPETKETAL